MIPFDTKNYRAPRSLINKPWIAVILIIMLAALLGWMGERDREAHYERMQAVAAAKCTGITNAISQ